MALWPIQKARNDLVFNDKASMTGAVQRASEMVVKNF
jgi:hypothetical protein